MNIKKYVVAPVQAAIQNTFPYLSAVLTPFLSAHPEWEYAFYSAIGLYGIYMAYNQEEVNEIIQFISEHPDKFRKEIVRSEEFKKGFLNHTEQYLKLRSKQKKQILNKILLGFTQSKEKSKYELERLDDVMMRISIESLEFLTFFKKVIAPAIEEQIKSELKQDSYQKSDRSLDWWHDFMIESKPIWAPIEKWVYENFNSNSHKVKTQYKMTHSGFPPELLHKIENLERAKRNEFIESITELVSLGILRLRVTGGTLGGGSGSEYSFTRFGRIFLNFISI